MSFMKNLLSLLFTLMSFPLFSQDLSDINKDLSLPDVLQHEREIRIYKGFGATNYTAVFRLFQDSTQTWRAELNEHWAEVKGIVDMNKGCNILSSKDNPERIWLGFLLSYAIELPDMEDIRWKLASRAKIVERKGKLTLSKLVNMIADGTSYVMLIRYGSARNMVTYWNPESHLESYPEIDELIYFKEILDHIRTTYDIWKD